MSSRRPNKSLHPPNRAKMTREELRLQLRVVNGEWSCSAGGHWDSIFELYNDLE